MKNISIKISFLRKKETDNDSNYNVSMSNVKYYKYLIYYLKLFLDKINHENEDDINITSDNLNLVEEKNNRGQVLSGFDNNGYIFIKRTNKMIRVSLKDIVRLEAARNYCDIILKDNKRIDVCVPMNEVYEDLDHNCFFRINRSCVINIAYVIEISGNMVNLEEVHFL